MQALVKYHGLRDWKLRLPYHDSISVNTTSMKTVATITDKERGGVFVDGTANGSANVRLAGVLEGLAPGSAVESFRIDSKNIPAGRAKGIGYSSSAGAALTLLCHRLLVGGEPDMRELSRRARVFAASASRSMVGGFSRLYAGKTDEEAYSERFADGREMDLRMVIVPLPSRVRTEDAHKEVLTSPFFDARVASAQKRCDEMEKAIRGNDLERLGVLAERDTLELHSLTMTGESRLIIMTEDSIRIISKVRQLRSEGLDAYFSLQTGPSVFINTSERHEKKVFAAIARLGYRAYFSKVGGEARIVAAPKG
ncbi:MAG: diphosphomevalonate decarboxylase [Nitrososphaerota archaeon]|nr:diphosphomevalonate decarboxylase [Nitrososphaerota archaeon]